MKRPSPSDVTAAKERVRSWIALSDLPRAKIAKDADVDEKTVRQAASDKWNPTVDTLAKLEAIIPKDWSAGAQPKKRRAA